MWLRFLSPFFLSLPPSLFKYYYKGHGKPANPLVLRMGKPRPKDLKGVFHRFYDWVGFLESRQD